jgi:hypothetical protein
MTLELFFEILANGIYMEMKFEVAIQVEKREEFVPETRKEMKVFLES